MRCQTNAGDRGSIRVWLLAATLIICCPSVGADKPIFTGDTIVDLTIRAPIKQVLRQPGTSAKADGELILADGTVVPMRFGNYGISRLRECQLASLIFTVEAEDVRNTPFEGHATLRMVTPCRFRGDFDRYTLLEYLVYKSYLVVANPALRTRLVKVTFHDTANPSKEEQGYSFFVEDIDEAAHASNQKWIDVEAAQLNQLDLAKLMTMTVFQYMVGNTDWSALAGRKGERCCHNVALLGEPDGKVSAVLPFDFDQSGIVNPPYATPSAELGIKRVTDREWRGFCELNNLLPDTIEVFNRKRPELEALFLDNSLPYPKDRKRAWKYIADFFRVINNPKKLESKILARCR